MERRALMKSVALGVMGTTLVGVGSTGPFRVEPGPAAGACGIVC